MAGPMPIRTVGGFPEWDRRCRRRRVNIITLTSSRSSKSVNSDLSSQKNQKVLECPKDYAQRGSGTARANYGARLQKITSYTFNGAVSGWNRRPLPNALQGGTYKQSDFSGTDILLWEPDETDPFNFNDAAQNPEDTDEGVSRRHAGASTVTRATSSGGAIIGRIGASAEMMKYAKMLALQRAQPQLRNEIYIGPSYR